MVQVKNVSQYPNLVKAYSLPVSTYVLYGQMSRQGRGVAQGKARQGKFLSTGSTTLPTEPRVCVWGKRGFVLLYGTYGCWSPLLGETKKKKRKNSKTSHHPHHPTAMGTYRTKK